jgi:methyl-accepting chemotaxis protein
MATKQDPKSKQTAPKEDEQKRNSATSSKAAAEKETGDTEKLDSLLEVLEGDLTTVDTEDAFSTIDEWHTTLNKSKEPEFKELASGLKELKQLLKGGKATGHDIGEVLSDIGDQTTDIASSSDNGVKTTLQKLGKQLSKVGYALGKAEDKDSVEQIESLSETLDGDLTKIDTETAVGTIDHWYGLLNKSDNQNLKEIANGLKELKQILKRKNANASDIAEALNKVGEQTTEAASEAHRGLKGPIRKFGKLLSKTGKSLG